MEFKLVELKLILYVNGAERGGAGWGNTRTRPGLKKKSHTRPKPVY